MTCKKTPNNNNINKVHKQHKTAQKSKSFQQNGKTWIRSLVHILLYLKYFILQLNIESMARYVSPVNPAIFATLTLVLLAIGLFFTAWFFVYEVTSTKFTREKPKELLISLVASIFMGLGSHFLILWVGIYVQCQDLISFLYFYWHLLFQPKYCFSAVIC